MTYLTSPEVKNATSAYRFIVELYSKQVDEDEIPVDYEFLDIVVTDPTEATIRQLLQVSGYLELWQLVDYWMPEPYSPF